MTLPSFCGTKAEVFNPETAKTYLGLLMAEMNEGEVELFNETNVENFGFIGKVLFQRLAWTQGVQVTVRCAVLVTILSGGSPGGAVLWAWTLREIWLKTKQPVSLAVWTDAFPLGAPIQSEVDRIWDAQKGDGPAGNQLDNVIIWNVNS
jgi:hypothetical protein